MLEERDEDSVCGLCFGVMVKPASGCPEGHCFCKPCYSKALAKKKSCPACRASVKDAKKLVPNRTAANLIAKMWLRCDLVEGKEAGPSAAKRAKLAPAASMTGNELKNELRIHALQTTGNKAKLVARLEEGRKQGAKCRWRGRVGELAVHMAECIREATCGHCTQLMECRVLALHEGRCPHAQITCPNEGCSVQHARVEMNCHRARECDHEEVTCACPGCDKRLLRKDLAVHVEATHLEGAGQQLQSLWDDIAVQEERAAASESEQRHAAASPTSWVFNWRAAGWESGSFFSEPRDFGGGAQGWCTHQCYSDDVEESYLIAFGMEGIATCRMHATFSILDKHDKTLRTVYEFGTFAAPPAIDGALYWGGEFTPTAEEKAQSVRADGSIRLRAVVRLFLDGAA